MMPTPEQIEHAIRLHVGVWIARVRTFFHGLEQRNLDPYFSPAYWRVRSAS